VLTSPLLLAVSALLLLPLPPLLLPLLLLLLAELAKRHTTNKQDPPVPTVAPALH
jgi:hypothetical protein